MFNDILTLIRRHDVIVLHRHLSPDGDALGSQIGLKHIILDNFPGKTVYMTGDPAGRYAFMADSVMDEVPDHVFPGALSVILDCSAVHLIADSRYQQAAAACRIDHHLFCGQIVPTEAIDTTSESCCGLIAALAMEAGLTVSSLAATSLYTGMVTDSGRFRYDATSAKTHRLAAYLMEREFDTADIYRNLYSDDLAFIRLRARFTLKIQTTDHRVAYIYTDRAEAESYGVSMFTLSRGFVNVMSEIRGIDSWVNFTETEDGVLCEIRSSRYNINPIAVKYGGGGHRKASGCTLSGREEAMRLLDDLNQLAEDPAHES